MYLSADLIAPLNFKSYILKYGGKGYITEWSHQGILEAVP